MQQTGMDRLPGAAGTIKVWDLPIRLFHWALAAGFAAAWLTAKFHMNDIHALTGYALCLLLAARIYWGFAGGRHARFSSFVFSPGETMAYLRSVFGRSPLKHYLGHNPAGALMVFTLLGLLGMILASGMAALAVIDFEGPLLALHHVDDETAYAIRNSHEWLGNAALALVALHLAGVVVGSIQHGENLVRAMVTGNKKSGNNQ
jgi:cytochrome b